jgi:uridine monophosphate synthetase
MNIKKKEQYTYMKDTIIKELFKTNCIKLGNFTLKSGEVSKYYYDMKNIISNPRLLKQIGDELYNLLDDFDIICGIPYGALPIATYISTQYNKPLIYIRDKQKEYGTQKMIEGEYKKEDRCVIIDDVITSGRSLEEEIEKLKDKVTIVDVAVIMNRQQNPQCSMKFKSLLYKNDITKYLLQSISESKKSKLIFSADISNCQKIIEIIEKIGKHIVACKIHSDMIDNFETYIPELIELSIKHNFLIMEDRKFNDISYIVNMQYKKFRNWVDLVTVHSLVTNDVLSVLSGCLIVANMSNNNYNFKEKALQMAKDNKDNVVGFITQERINMNGMVCMTPGISSSNSKIDDQKYRTSEEVDTDYIIVGRAIYNRKEDELEKAVQNIM